VNVNGPADVLAAAFAALNLDDWNGFTDLCDPVSLRVFKRETLESYADATEDYHIEPDDLIESEPDMPREAAEYKAAQMNQIASKAHRLKREFLTVKDVDELCAMDASKMFVLWLQAHSPYRRAALEPHNEEPWELDSDWDPPVDDGKKETRGYRYSVVGSVIEGGEIAHVLYRDDNTVDKIFPEEYAGVMASRPADEQELARQLHHHSHPQIVTFRRQADSTWRLVANGYLMLVSTLQRV
jgi:hypothetical protein